MGAESVYTLTSKYERDEGCAICGPGVTLEVQPTMTLAQVRLRLLPFPFVPVARAFQGGLPSQGRLPPPPP